MPEFSYDDHDLPHGFHLVEARHTACEACWEVARAVAQTAHAARQPWGHAISGDGLHAAGARNW